MGKNGRGNNARKRILSPPTGVQINTRLYDRTT